MICKYFGCTGLTSVDIPNSVTTIGYSAFEGCGNLNNISIPNSVTTIEQSAFTNTGWYKNQSSGCLYLDNCLIGYKGSKPTGDLSITVGTRLIAGSAFSTCSGLTSVTIPNSVTEIGNYAFHGCSGLTSITIPSSVTEIGNYAFSGCSGLTSITIPSSVTSIGRAIFYKCSGLTSIIVEAGNTKYDSRNNCVTNIGEYAFHGCSGLTSVTIPNSVTEIGYYAFEDCSVLTDVYCKAMNVPTLTTNIGTNATLHVPAGSLTAYSTTDYWKNFNNIVALASTYYGCLTVTEGGPSTYDIAIDGNSTTDLALTTAVTGDVTFTRDFTAAKKATICLPFAVSASKAATLGKFYQFSGLKAGTTDVVQMTEVTTDLVANTPYVFEPSATVTSIDFGSQTITANPAPVDPGTGSYAFQGTYGYKTWSPGDEEITNGAYGFALSGFEGEGFEEGAFVRLGSGATVRPFRAYLKNAGNLNDASATARRRAANDVPDVIRIEWVAANGTTSISGIKDVDEVQNGWYSLDSRKLSEKPATKGIFIHNGRKVVIK